MTTCASTPCTGVFGELAALGSFRLGLTGGEPLLRKDLLDVIDAATAHGLHPCLTTNGLLLDEPLARELGRRELVWVNVSLDGATAATNDRVRGAGTFDEVVRRLRAVRDHLRFTLAFTITRDSASEVIACAELARELGAHTAVFRPVYPTGTARAHPALMPSFAAYSAALARLASSEAERWEISPIDDEAGHILAGSTRRASDARGAREAEPSSLGSFGPSERVASQAITYRGPGCGAANLVASISATGEVNPCSFLGAAFDSGNVRDRPFAEIWAAGQAFARLREHRDGDRFRGGCRARALAAHGDAHAADPWHDEWLARGAGEHPLANVHVSRVHLPVLP
jgi:radical SAM protein with 4Fe4S-binding SPASM domain